VRLQRHHLRRNQRVSELSHDQREELIRWAQSRTLPAGDVFRVRLILALADGKNWGQIETELRTSRPTVARWKQRYEEQGLAGLDPWHKGSQPRQASPAVQARMLRRTLQKVLDGRTHWSCGRWPLRSG
jgi:transposase